MLFDMIINIKRKEFYKNWRKITYVKFNAFISIKSESEM